MFVGAKDIVTRVEGWSLRVWLLGLALAALALGAPMQSAFAADATRSSVEDWVLGKLVSGQEADLNSAPVASADEARTLSGAFVTDLLTNSLPDQQIHRNGIHIVNAIIRGPIAISGAEIPHEVSITHSQFDSVSITHSVFKKSLTLDWSTIGSADFGSTNFTSGAYFSNAQFAGPVSFRYSNITNVLIAAGARFLDTEHPADLNSASISSGLFLYESEFHGGADLGSLHTNYIDLRHAVFWPAKTTCSLLADDGNALFDDVRFGGPIDCGSAVIKGDLSLNRTQFNSLTDFTHASIGGVAGKQVFATQGLVFDRAKISGDVALPGLVSTGPLTFNAAAVGGDLTLTGLRVFDTESGLAIGNAHIQGNADISGALIKGPIGLAASEMLGLDMRQTQLTGTRAADFSAVKITRDGSFDHTRFEVPTYFSNASFGLGASFVSAQLPSGRQFHIDGLSYRDLYLTPSDGSRAVTQWHDALRFFEQAAYWPSNYVDLESYFRRLGRVDDANLAYEQGRRVQRIAPLHDGRFDAGAVLPYVVDSAMDIGVCYGRCPQNVVIPGLIIVALGTLIFWSKEWMQPIDSQKSSFWYNPLMYSLDLFAPVINLGARDVWVANQTKRCMARWWEGLQMLAGWILVPIGLAALTGLFK